MNIYNILIRLMGVLVLFFLLEPLGAPAMAAQEAYSEEELNQMLAPVALYPDELLTQVLMASTYPLEIVQADRWVKENPHLSGSDLDSALQEKDWDASVKALCHVPDVLALMSERLDETTRLGDAFLAQESKVMDVIQDLRSLAYKEGNLRSDRKQKVTHETDDTIVIEPVAERTVYVPYYDTRCVYGHWWYPAYPPWYWGPPGVVVGSGIWFWPRSYVSFGFRLGYWSYFDWYRRSIYIRVHRRPSFFRHDHDWKSYRGRWHHKPHHRRDGRKDGRTGYEGHRTRHDRGSERYRGQESSTRHYGRHRSDRERRGGYNLRGFAPPDSTRSNPGRVRSGRVTGTRQYDPGRSRQSDRFQRGDSVQARKQARKQVREQVREPVKNPERVQSDYRGRGLSIGLSPGESRYGKILRRHRGSGVSNEIRQQRGSRGTRGGRFRNR